MHTARSTRPLDRRLRTRVRRAWSRSSRIVATCCAAGSVLLINTFIITLPAAGQTGAATAVLTLPQLLDSVAARHPLIAAASARVRAARAGRASAGTLGNPILAFQVENAPLPGRAAPPMERESMATATLPLEFLYQRGPRVRRAEAEVRAAEAEAAVQRQHVGLDAVGTFYRVALAQVAFDAARDLAGWLDSVVAYNRVRAREGVAAEADLIRSELERDRAAADATMQEADLARARAELATFLGDPRVARDLSVAAGDAPLPLPDGPLMLVAFATGARSAAPGAAARPAASDAPRIALGNRAMDGRPEVRAARERLAAAGASIAAERTMLVRQLGATVGTKWSVGTTSLIAGVSLPFPLFDRNRGEVARAAAEREAAAFELAAEERAAYAQIAGAYEAARLLTERAELLARGGSGGYLARADEARRIALGAYREGAVPLIQVLDAARAWGEARLAYYRTLYGQHESVLELLAAQGIDLTAALPALAPRAAPGGVNR
ncbi:MAG: TolC family protein [Gemmatimonadaceae bacterium]